MLSALLQREASRLPVWPFSLKQLSTVESSIVSSSQSYGPTCILRVAELRDGWAGSRGQEFSPGIVMAMFAPWSLRIRALENKIETLITSLMFCDSTSV